MGECCCSSFFRFGLWCRLQREVVRSLSHCGFQKDIVNSQHTDCRLCGLQVRRLFCLCGLRISHNPNVHLGFLPCKSGFLSRVVALRFVCKGRCEGCLCFLFCSKKGFVCSLCSVLFCRKIIVHRKTRAISPQEKTISFSSYSLDFSFVPSVS